MVSVSRFRCLWLIFALVVAACQPDGAAPTSVALAPMTPVKLLATVYISPTPDAAQQQATLLASTATATAPPSTPTATPTVYIGVFVGEAGSLDDSAALAALDQLQTQRDAPTAVPDRLSVCPLQPDEAFGTLWRAAGALADELGCPAALPTPFSGISQVYERGVMYRTPDGELWAFTPRGDPTGQFWYAAQPPQVSIEGVSAPTNLRPPGQRFAAFWQAQPQIRERLGFAQTDEVGTTFTVQLFQNGALLLDNSAAQVWLMVGTGDSGPAMGPY